MSDVSDQSYDPNQFTISSIMPEMPENITEVAAHGVEPDSSLQSVSGEDDGYAYPNAATCPDCGSSMILYGRCVSCPSCGLEGCGI